MSHRKKKPFGKMDFAEFSSSTPSTPLNGLVNSGNNGRVQDPTDSAASLIAAALGSVALHSNSDPLPPSHSLANSTSTSEDSLNTCDSLDDTLDVNSKKPARRPRPKPINLQQVSMIKASTAAAAAAAGLNPSVITKLTPAITVNHIDLYEKDLESLEELGMGSGGTVYRVRHTPTNTVMAKKIIHQLDSNTSAQILRELQILKKCNSQHIISFYGAYENQGDLCICMEYMDVGSLEKIGKVAGKLTETILSKLTVAVIDGLVYLYESFKIVHRDIKPSNILVNSHGKIKLCDFGVSGVLENSVANTFVGTGAYMSPERIQGGKYAIQCDTWSLGLTLLEMAIGRYPFHASQQQSEDEQVQISVFELLQQIINDPTPRLPRPTDPVSEGGGQFTNEFCDFIAATLEKDPKQRPTPKQLTTHSFVLASAAIHVDMGAWARTFLEPNLNTEQVRRWSVTQNKKRESWLSIVEKRKSGFRGASALNVVSSKVESPNSAAFSPAVLDDIPASPPAPRRNR